MKLLIFVFSGHNLVLLQDHEVAGVKPVINICPRDSIKYQASDK